MTDGKQTVNPQLSSKHYYEEGITKREYFAALAMQGIIAKPNTLGENSKIAAVAVDMADALIDALNK
jgi:hypothetical protein